jgi:mRNA-degrading endonuclease RelE of RelBE toxin-antitoxin system
VAYRIVTDSRVRAQIRALPAEALRLIAEALSVLELTPWNGGPYNATDPDGWMRHLDLADVRGFITYLVLDDQDRVDVLNVTWFG